MKEKTPGVFHPQEIYTVAEFRRRAGLGQYAWRQLRQGGFPVVEVGRKLYVRGLDWCEHIDQLANFQSHERRAANG